VIDVQDTQKSVRSSRVDGPPPLPPRLSDKKAPNLDTLSGGAKGTPPSGELMQIVLEHAQLAEQILTSLGHMLPSFVPVASQLIASMRLGVVSSLKQATAQPNQSLAAGAGPAQPPQPSTPDQNGGGGAQGAGVPPPPTAGAGVPSAGIGAPAQ
jgi:hypothetical protein